MADIEVKQKEAKTIVFTVTDGAGAALDCSAATAIVFAAKTALADTAYVLSKALTDFDLTDAATGVLRLPLSADDLDLDARQYSAELKISFSASHIDKSATLTLKVERAVTD